MNARDRIIEQRMAKRRRNVLIMKSIIAALILLIIGMAVVLIKAGILNVAMDTATKQTNQMLGKKGSGDDAAAAQEGTEQAGQDVTVSTEEKVAQLRAQAEAYAAVYDYQGALNLLKNAAEYDGSVELQNAAAAYQKARDESVSYPVDEVTHIFFHSLINDDRAFNADLVGADRVRQNNAAMTTTA